jgi:hypothetical protein
VICFYNPETEVIGWKLDIEVRLPLGTWSLFLSIVSETAMEISQCPAVLSLHEDGELMGPIPASDAETDRVVCCTWSYRLNVVFIYKPEGLGFPSLCNWIFRFT